MNWSVTFFIWNVMEGHVMVTCKVYRSKKWNHLKVLAKTNTYTVRKLYLVYIKCSCQDKSCGLTNVQMKIPKSKVVHGACVLPAKSGQHFELWWADKWRNRWIDRQTDNGEEISVCWPAYAGDTSMYASILQNFVGGGHKKLTSFRKRIIWKKARYFKKIKPKIETAQLQ